MLAIKPVDPLEAARNVPKDRRHQSYGAYISAFKDFDEAVNQVREEYSREHYGKALVELDDTARAAVLKEIPRTILELDPKNNR